MGQYAKYQTEVEGRVNIGNAHQPRSDIVGYRPMYYASYVTFYAKRDHVPELVIFSSRPKFLNDLFFVNSEISVFS